MNEQSSIPVEAQAVPDQPVAPWPDFQGQPIRHGDRLTHPTGAGFVAVCLAGHDSPGDAWRAVYDDATVSRLSLQIGDKGQAVVTRPTPAAADQQEKLRELAGAIEQEFVRLEDLPAFIHRLQDEVRASRAAADPAAVGINGLTEAETSATASVMGLVAASPAAAAAQQEQSHSVHLAVNDAGQDFRGGRALSTSDELVVGEWYWFRVKGNPLQDTLRPYQVKTTSGLKYVDAGGMRMWCDPTNDQVFDHYEAWGPIPLPKDQQ